MKDFILRQEERLYFRITEQGIIFQTELQKKVSRPIHVAFICAFSRFLPCCQVEGLQRYQTSRIDRVYDSFP